MRFTRFFFPHFLCEISLLSALIGDVYFLHFLCALKSARDKAQMKLSSHTRLNTRKDLKKISFCFYRYTIYKRVCSQLKVHTKECHHHKSTCKSAQIERWRRKFRYSIEKIPLGIQFFVVFGKAIFIHSLFKMILKNRCFFLRKSNVIRITDTEI